MWRCICPTGWQEASMGDDVQGETWHCEGPGDRKSSTKNCYQVSIPFLFSETLFNILRYTCHFWFHCVFFLLRGVVQLFNAVRKHQKTIDDKVKEVGGSERKKAKFLSCVSKKDFIDLLRKTDGGKGVTTKTEKNAVSSMMSFLSLLHGNMKRMVCQCLCYEPVLLLLCLVAVKLLIHVCSIIFYTKPVREKKTTKVVLHLFMTNKLWFHWVLSWGHCYFMKALRRHGSELKAGHSIESECVR